MIAGNQGQNIYPSPENFPVTSFPQPVPAPSVDPDDAGTLLLVQYSWEWQQVLLAAIDQLRNPATWQGEHDEIITALNRATNLKEMLQQRVYLNVPSPFWDNESDNEISLPEDEQTWYGAVTDWLAPVDELDFVQNIALWALTGFVAYAAGVGSAIFFRSTAKRFILALEVGDIPEIIRVVVDSAEFNIDTSGLDVGTIIEQEVITDPAITEHDIYIMKGEYP